MSADAHWEGKKIKTNRNLHNPFWDRPKSLWGQTLAQGPLESPGKGAWSHWVSLWNPVKARALTEPRPSCQLLPCGAGQWQGPTGKERVESQQTWVLPPALHLLAV